MGGEATVAFVSGPDTPPQSDGSAKFTVPPPPDSDTAFAQLRSEDFLGVGIKDLTALTYSVFVAPTNSICPAFDFPYIVLYVTTTGGSEDVIVSVPQGAPFACGSWTIRNALSDLWWSPTLDGGTFAPLANPKPLADFATAFPGLAMRNDATPDAECPKALGGLRIAAGNWGAVNQVGDYGANVSFVTVGVSGKEQTATF